MRDHIMYHESYRHAFLSRIRMLLVSMLTHVPSFNAAWHMCSGPACKLPSICSALDHRKQDLQGKDTYT